MGRKSTIIEANNLAEKKQAFLFLLTANIDARAKKYVMVMADNESTAIEYVKETYPLFVGQIVKAVKGAVIL